ncbi:unnamed protein product [Clonostachys byssicola]|uniref:HNH nuclease domain-containing protein n=1 Tax=Clonostachys byssicola TaxID=160290 RepID=A0A9N9U5J5_9HYPO|nr:unnamed protein product [Clonostachys byssicola]
MSQPSGKETAKVALNHFFGTNPTDAEVQACVAFLAASDISTEAQGPEDHTNIHELIQRIALARKAQEKITNAKGNNPAATKQSLELNLAHLSYFLCAEKESLKKIVNETPNHLDARLRTIEPFVKMMLQKDFRLPFPINIGPGSGAADTTYQPKAKRVKVGNAIDRNQATANEARQRDQRCIATGCPVFEACHIMPFSVNNTSAKLETAREILTDIVMPMLSTDDWEIVQKLVVPGSPGSGEVGISDEPCNILCLNPLAHKIFDKAYFAFEWVGLSNKRELDDETYRTVRLRWHWLPKCVADSLGQTYLHERTSRKGDTGRLLKFGDGSDHGMAAAIHRHLTNTTNTSMISSHGVSLHRMENHRPLVTGTILLIKVKEADLDKTRLLIQIQWLALRMAAISGAAEVVDELDSEPPGSLDELPTSRRAMLQAETDELYDVVLPERRQMFAAQRAPESPDTEEAGPAPKADAEAESMAARSPTRRDDPPRDDAEGLEDP